MLYYFSDIYFYNIISLFCKILLPSKYALPVLLWFIINKILQLFYLFCSINLNKYADVFCWLTVLYIYIYVDEWFVHYEIGFEYNYIKNFNTAKFGLHYVII